MLNTEVFLNFLLSVRQITNADTVSLLIDAKHQPYADVILLHEGSAPLAEFVSTDSAKLAINTLVNEGPGVQSLPTGPINVGKSSKEKGCLIRINFAQITQYLAKTATHSKGIDRRNSRKNKDQTVYPDEFWLALNFSSSTLPEFIEILLSEKVNSYTDRPQSSDDWFVHLLCQGALMVWQNFQYASVFKDPSSLLPGQIEFQISLKKILFEAVNNKSTVGLLLLSPDEFITVNQRLGREQGDLALADITDKLLSILRHDDLVFRYGGAMFALILPETNLKNINTLMEKIHQGLSGSYLDEAVQLTFSVGVAIQPAASPANSHENLIDLIKQADQALNLAKLSGGGHSIIWDEENVDTSVLSLDRLGNIFTSESEKDYRNMLLLWDTLAVISSASDTQQIAIEFIERVKQTLKPYRIGLFEENKETPYVALAARYGQNNTVEKIDQQWDLSQQQKRLLETVKQGQRTERLRYTGDYGNTKYKEIVAYGFPLLVREQVIGYLYIDGPEKTFSLDTSDLVFINAVVRQLALAVDRSALQLRWKEEKEKESRILKQEVRELRHAIHSAKLIYCSEQMQSLLETLSSVAPTDVTILINGESGTGKEMLARSLHEQSLRKKKPLITVDCGAIAYSLIEAELFGHVKGAYTGAQGSSQGKILQAEGGTLFLDEIGELPLDVQAKLLRFVQEKEINPVGGGKTKQVDVRIVAATNKDLAVEVSEGRFRGDLYYRLNVITLKAPALRERPDDIIPLARHFLEKFAVLYEKGMLHLNDEAEQVLLAYQWPGNIRELQNTIMRAVVLSKQQSIGLDVLNIKVNALAESAVSPAVYNQAVEQYSEPKAIPVGGVVLSTQQPQTEKPVPVPEIKNNDIWDELRQNLHLKIKLILETDKILALPLGRWLTEDLILEADRVERGVARRASQRLGIAETTFRRQVDKLKQTEQAGLLSRTADWQNIKPYLVELVTQADKSSSKNMIEQVRNLLLHEIIKLLPNDKSLGSALMGVTLPTYHRWQEKIAE